MLDQKLNPEAEAMPSHKASQHHHCYVSVQLDLISGQAANSWYGKYDALSTVMTQRQGYCSWISELEIQTAHRVLQKPSNSSAQAKEKGR